MAAPSSDKESLCKLVLILGIITNKKAFKIYHLGFWNVKRKPPARANGPPTESLIIYDESSSPGVEDYLIDANRTTLRLSTGYSIDLSRRSSKNKDGNLHLKNPAAGKAVSYAQICLNAQFHVKKTMLTIKPASAIRKVIVCVNGCFNMLR